ncbi:MULTISPECIES: dihydroorotate dehydrogenase [Paenibacillus]|uniref:hypothetical protein n=1 Tax=Paenibacillus TaxID=44249 RepID=UPI0022B8EB06|nr:hypothetical protein [Paenibacillus caseinilyticus]MCZ8519953.1 hypothetical protein [Paenibacillus caseinilyticus]
MPDWSYQSLFRPLLFRLPSLAARDITLGAMGLLSRIPGGTFVIKTLGYMESHPILESRLFGITLKYPVGLSGSLDVYGTAQKALAQFGFGFIEIGPVTLREVEASLPVGRNAEEETLRYPEPAVNGGLDSLLRQMSRGAGHSLPHFFRLCPMPGASPAEAKGQLLEMAAKLAPYAAGFYIDVLTPETRDTWTLEEAAGVLRAVRAAGRMPPEEGGRPMLFYLPLDFTAGGFAALLPILREQAWDGLVVGEAIYSADGSAHIGREGLEPALGQLRRIRSGLGPELPLIAAGGIHQPQDALDAVEAGADCVQLHSGLVFSGPGLPKRINEALIYEKVREAAPPVPPTFWSHWRWMCLLGLGMILGGVIAWLIAATTVVLPYDIGYLGMDPLLLSLANSGILPFMSHDRVTLAGTMISIGIVYFQLAYHGLRLGQHWTRTALLTSGLVGFSSFFLYLGYGYFDPLHALAAAVLLPMFVLAMRAPADLPSPEPANLHNSKAWRRAQAGQLLFVMLGFALAAGGGVIAGIGITRVFVPTDLEYLCATPEMLAAINDRLIPLIAHDRAGFGGALFSDALAVLILSLWGIGQGRRWVWWTLALGGLPAFLAGFSVHYTIGYTNFVHLLPAYVAFALYAGGLVLLYPYMMREVPRRV